jgi:hypothetical protein
MVYYVALLLSFCIKPKRLQLLKVAPAQAHEIFGLSIKGSARHIMRWTALVLLKKYGIEMPQWKDALRRYLEEKGHF